MTHIWVGTNPVSSSVAHKHSTKRLEGHRIHFSAAKQCGIYFQYTGVTAVNSALTVWCSAHSVQVGKQQNHSAECDCALVSRWGHALLAPATIFAVVLGSHGQVLFVRDFTGFLDTQNGGFCMRKMPFLPTANLLCRRKNPPLGLYP